MMRRTITFNEPMKKKETEFLTEEESQGWSIGESVQTSDSSSQRERSFMLEAQDFGHHRRPESQY